MRVFAIKNENNKEEPIYAYLLYFEMSRKYFIEITDNCDEWSVPIFLSSFVKKKQRTVPSKWSRIWVQQRIVPTDRQNLGQILRENGLTCYDEFRLLLLSMGRCAQDDYYLEETSEEMLPNEIKKRRQKRIKDVVPIEKNSLLVFFCNGKVKKCNMEKLCENNPKLKTLITTYPEFYTDVKIQSGGFELYWDENLFISCGELYLSGQTVPLSLDDFRSFARYRIVTTSEAADALQCSRQNIDDLVKRGKLKIVKKSERTTLFLKSDIVERSW